MLEGRSFVRSAVPEGHTAAFVLDPAKGRVAFQVRPGLIEVDTFQWNFQALLREGAPETRPKVRWEVRKVLNTESLDEFLARATRVDKMMFTLRMPNPDFHGLDQIKEIVGDTKSGIVSMIMNAEKDELDGIDINAAFIIQARAHALRYGKTGAKAHFEDDQGNLYEDKWRSEKEGTPRTETAPVNPATGEVSTEQLIQSLQSEELGQSSHEDDEDVDE